MSLLRLELGANLTKLLLAPARANPDDEAVLAAR